VGSSFHRQGAANDGSGDGTGSFEVKIKTKTAKFTNMIIARFRESRYLVRESEGFRTPGV